MKFTTYLKEIEHVSIYPIITLVLFVALFVFILFYVYGGSKKDMQDKGNLPLN